MQNTEVMLRTTIWQCWSYPIQFSPQVRSLPTGMEDTFISWEDTVDPSGCRWGPELYQKYSRDPARTPMQWDDTDFAGKNFVWALLKRWEGS